MLAFTIAIALSLLIGAGSLLAVHGLRWWFAPSPALLAVLVSYPLWSWRQIEIAARSLRHEQALARAPLRAIGDAVVTTDHAGIVTYMNPVAETLSKHALRDARGRHIATIFWSPQVQERNKFTQLIEQALREGWPVRSHLHAHLSTQFGETYVVRITASPIDPAPGVERGAMVALYDMTETVHLTQQVEHQFTHDALTRLPNRALVTDRLTQAIAAAHRSGEWIAVLFLDLDGFKHINASRGHAVGDVLLRKLAERLRDDSRPADTVARWDGDQFSVLLLGLPHADAAVASARRLRDLNTSPYVIDDQEIYVTAGIGISLYPRDGNDPETLFKNADTALHRIKQRERNGIGFFAEDDDQHAHARMELELSLRQAIRRHEFEVYYQPQLSLRSGLIVGVEALVRWHHPSRGLVLPGAFIALAEESDLIGDIGLLVLQAACAQSRAWCDQGQAIQISVNVSARQFIKDDLSAVIDATLRDSGADPHLITLELTESTVMHDADRVADVITRAQGQWRQGLNRRFRHRLFVSSESQALAH